MQIQVTKNKVILPDNYIVNKGEYHVNLLEFLFSEEYTNEMVKKAIFVSKDESIEQVIINNQCHIPNEMLNIKNFELRVYAYEIENEELVLRYSPTYAMVYLREGSYKSDTSSEETITPTQFEQFEQALNNGLNELESGLEEVSNVDIDASKSGNTATVTITKKDGTEKSVQISDGEKGDKGDDYVITQEDYQEIADIVENQINIPAKTSDLINDSGFTTKLVNDLSNYYLKSETYTKTEVNNLIGQIASIQFQLVNELPLTGNSSYIYLVPSSNPTTQNIKDEYIWVNNAWEQIGSTQIDLTGYATENWVNSQISNFLTSTQIQNLINASLNGYVQDNNYVHTDNNFSNTYKSDVDSNVSARHTHTNKSILDDISSTDITNWNNKSNFSGSYDDLTNKPTIPSEVTETTVTNWGFTKNVGTITGINMNGTSKGTSGVIDLGTVITSHQDISGKEDAANKVTSLSSSSTDTQYPSAKTVYDNFVTRDEEIEKLQTENAQLLADHPDILDENNKFPSGTDLTLNGTGDLKMKVDVGGNSTQVQYEGYNLLNIPNNEITLVKLTNRVVNISPINTPTLEAGTYTIVFPDLVLTNNVENLGVQLVGLENQGNLLSNKKRTITLTKQATLNRLYCFLASSDNDNATAKFTKIMLYEGTTEKPYEPYVGGTASPNPNYKQDINNVEGNVEVKAESRNMLVLEDIAKTTKNGVTYKLEKNKLYINGTCSTSFELFRKSIAYNSNDYTIQVKILSGSISGNANSFNVLETNSTRRALVFNGNAYLTFTGDISSVFTNINNGAIFQNAIIGFQIEKGTTATPYVPHAENTVTFPLSQGQKLMLGDTLEDDGIHHKRGQITFTGTTATLSDAKTNGAYLCDQKTSGNLSGQTLTFDSAVTNATIEYELATETIEIYTEAQQIAYNKLKEMHSYYDLTYVIGTSDNAQPILTAQAKKSLKVMQNEINNIESRLSLLE